MFTKNFVEPHVIEVGTVSPWIGHIYTPSPDDECQDRRFVEPWRPAIGTKVRVRIHAECMLRNFAGSIAQRVGTPSGHRVEVDGRIATVCEIPPKLKDRVRPFIQAGHCYLVKYDEELVVQGHPFNSEFLAACEMEPLEWEEERMIGFTHE